MPPLPTRRVLGVDFFIGSLDDAVDHAVGVSLREKFKLKDDSESDGLSLHLNLKSSPVEGATARNTRLIVAPSAPGLAVDLVKSSSYREALTTANLVLTDSGFMVLLWRAFTGEKLPRHSGLKFIRAVLDRPELKKPGAVFWVMPSADEDTRNRAWLVSQGFPVASEDVYLAPHYTAGPIHDPELVSRIEARNPRIVMLAIGGGVQERVGLMLRAELRCSAAPAVEGESLSESVEFAPDTSDLNFNLALNRTSPALQREGPSILCLGAAIAFLTGGQANIPPWADKLILGWMLRLLSNPRKFWRRYWDALSLARLLWRNRDRLPPMALNAT